MRSGELQLLDALVSRDASRSAEAISELLAESDPETLAWFAPHADAILAAVEETTYPPSIVARRTWAEIAVARATSAAEGRCPCLVLPTTRLVSVRSETARGRMEIVAELTPDDPSVSSRWDCRCVSCGRRYVVTETTGWHMPQYEWTPTARRTPAPAGPASDAVAATIDDIVSAERVRVDAGVAAIAATSELADLTALAARWLDLTVAVASTDWGSGVDEDTPARYRADFALDRLRALIDAGCDCAALPGIWKGRPSLDEEVTAQRMERVGPDRGRCRRCGTEFAVEEEVGRRFPLIATWTRLTEPPSVGGDADDRAVAEMGGHVAADGSSAPPA